MKETRSAAGDMRLGCWSGDDFVIVAARLMKVGPEGLMVIADAPIRADQPVWVRIDGPESVETVRATALGSTALRHGRCAVRFAFDDARPDAFVKHATARLAKDPGVPHGPAGFAGGPSWS